MLIRSCCDGFAPWPFRLGHLFRKLRVERIEQLAGHRRRLRFSVLPSAHRATTGTDKVPEVVTVHPGTLPEFAHIDSVCQV
jgi:hypothetical protein